MNYLGGRPEAGNLPVDDRFARWFPLRPALMVEAGIAKDPGMIAAVFGLSVVMIVTGAASLLSGIALIGNESGQARLIAGAVVVASGCIVFAVGCLTAAVNRLGRTDATVPVPDRDEEADAAPADDRTEPVGETAPEAADASPATDAPPAPADAPPRIPVATYSAGGIGYFMYEDGTIEADTELGRYRFSNMDELRRFTETGQGGIRV